jgi:hypothetical protein
MSLGKPTEMNLQDSLREELERRGVSVASQVSFRSVDGRRLMPDLVLRVHLEEEPNRGSK